MRLREANDDFSPSAIRNCCLRKLLTPLVGRPTQSLMMSGWVWSFTSVSKRLQRMILEAIEATLYTEKTESPNRSEN